MINMENKTKRIYWIDTLKGISILMVALGHIEECPEIYKFYFEPFFLTTFLICFGLTFNNKINFKDFVIKRIKTLLIPFFIFSLFIIFSRYIITFSVQESLFVEIKNMIFQIRGKGDDLWFIALIFITSIPFYFISKKVNNKKIYFGILLTCFISSYLYEFLDMSPLPWHIQVVGVSIFYIGIGYFIAHNEYINKILDIKYFNIKILAFFMLIVYISILILNLKVLNNTTFTFYSYSKNIIMYFLITIIGVYLNILIAKCLENSKILRFFGQNTLIIFALHGKIEKMLSVFFNSIINNGNFMVNEYILSLSILVFTMIILYVPIIIINKYFYFILGKKGGM